MDAERLAFSWSGYAGKKEILGRIREASFRLQKRRYYRNSFAPFFYGQFAPADSGTLITGEFRMHPFVRVFMAFWFSFLAVFVITALVLPSRGQQESAGGRAFILLIAGAFAVFGVGLMKFGQWLGNSKQNAIAAFLKKTLETDDAH